MAEATRFASKPCHPPFWLGQSTSVRLRPGGFSGPPRRGASFTSRMACSGAKFRLAALAAAALTLAAHCGEPRPATRGIAAKYPLDRGIEKDPAVLLLLDFEDPAKVAAWHGRRKGYGWTGERANVFAGRGALKINQFTYSAYVGGKWVSRRDQKLWDDQIVVATRYIGPMARPRSRPAPPRSRGRVGAGRGKQPHTRPATSVLPRGGYARPAITGSDPLVSAGGTGLFAHISSLTNRRK